MVLALKPRLAAKPAKSTSGSVWDSANFGEPGYGLASPRVTWLRSLLYRDRHDQARIGPLLPIVFDGDQLCHAVHLHRAVADERDHGPLGVSEFRADGVGRTGTHGGQVPDRGSAHVAAETKLTGIPVRRRIRVGRDDRVGRQLPRQLGEQSQRVYRVSADHGFHVHGFHQRDVAFDLLAPGPVGFTLQARESGLAVPM